MKKPYYQDSAVTIYHGDCRDFYFGADFIITDPPFGIGFAAQPTTGQRKRGQKNEKWDDVAPDLAHLFDKAENLCIWGGNYFSLPVCRGWLSWYKPDAPPSMGHFELAWTTLDRCTRQISCSIAQTNPERVGHPTQKPLRVMSWCIEQMRVDAEQNILDPFMGSGTTLRAAKDLGIKAIGIELDERYCEIAARRMGQEVLAL